MNVEELKAAMNAISGRGALTPEIKTELRKIGLSEQQVNSETAKLLICNFIPEKEQELIMEAARQVKRSRRIVQEAEERSRQLNSDILEIKKAEEEYGKINDERVRNALALFAAIINISKKRDADIDEVIQSAGYIVYAYLGGQGKRDDENHE